MAKSASFVSRLGGEVAKQSEEEGFSKPDAAFAEQPHEHVCEVFIPVCGGDTVGRHHSKLRPF